MYSQGMLGILSWLLQWRMILVCMNCILQSLLEGHVSLLGKLCK
jgi:hypothetical protein